MSLTNNSFINFDGSVVGGRTPTKLSVISTTGQALTDGQIGGVKNAYRAFCTSVKLSIIQQHFHQALLADGTRIQMSSIHGVDSVVVWPPPGEDVPTPLPLGIVISLFEVTVNEQYSTPFWEDEVRIPILIEKGASKYPGVKSPAEYNVLVTIDGKKKLSDDAFDDGQIKFTLVPSTVINKLALPSVFITEKDGETEWDKRAIPWYYNGVVTVGSWTLAVPNVAAALVGNSVQMFAAVDVAPYEVPYDQTSVTGWLFFLTTHIASQSYRLYGRRVLGTLDPTLSPSIHDSALACTLLASQPYAGITQVAPFGYELKRVVGSSGSYTLETSQKMFASEVVSSFTITVTPTGASATLMLSEVYVPPAAARPPNTYTAQLTRTVSGILTLDNPDYRYYQTGDALQEDESSYQATAGEQDPWTQEWTKLPGVRTVVAARTKNVLPGPNTQTVFAHPTQVDYGVLWGGAPASPPDPDHVTFTSWSGAGNVANLYDIVTVWTFADNAWTGTRTTNITTTTTTHSYSNAESVTLTSSGPNPGDNYSVSVTQADASAWNAPPASFSDTHFSALAVDQSPRRVAGVMQKFEKGVSFYAEGGITVTTTGLSLRTKFRDPAIADVVIYADFPGEFTQTLYGATPVSSQGYGVRIYSSGAAVTVSTDANGAATAFTLSGGNMTSRWLPMIDSAGTYVGNINYSAGTYSRAVVPNPSGPALVASQPFTENLTGGYSVAEYSAKFGVSAADLATVGVTNSVILTNGRFDSAVGLGVNSTGASAASHGAIFTYANIRVRTPRIFNDYPRMYADPRNNTFIFQMAGYGAVTWSGASATSYEPMLRLLVGNKFGTIPLEPQINAWITKINAARAQQSPPLPPFATYDIGDLFIDFDEKLPEYESTIY